MDQPRDNVAILDAEVVVGPVDVRGDDGGEVAAVFFPIGTTGNIQHALGVGVALVGVVRRPHVQLWCGRRERKQERERERRPGQVREVRQGKARQGKKARQELNK